MLAAGDVAVAHKWWEDALEKASANAYDQFMADAGLEVSLSSCRFARSVTTTDLTSYYTTYQGS